MLGLFSVGFVPYILSQVVIIEARRLDTIKHVSPNSIVYATMKVILQSVWCVCVSLSDLKVILQYVCVLFACLHELHLHLDVGTNIMSVVNILVLACR